MISPAEVARRVGEARPRIQPYVSLTPAIAGDGAWFKCENLQHTGSFKLRGALNKVLGTGEAERRNGVIAASTGNHGKAVAHALGLVDVRGTIFLPTSTPANKIDALRAYPNVELEFHGADSGQTEVYARAGSERDGRVFISPYNDLDVIAGQGTIALELLEQCAGLKSVFVAVGGGGLISGIGSVLKTRDPSLRVIGCWPANAPALRESLKAGRILENGEYAELPTLSDGTAGGIEPGAITYELARRVIDEALLVSEAEIAAAVRYAHVTLGMTIEGAAGVALAAYIQRPIRNSAVVLCGGNIAEATLERILAGHDG